MIYIKYDVTAVSQVKTELINSKYKYKETLIEGKKVNPPVMKY